MKRSEKEKLCKRRFNDGEIVLAKFGQYPLWPGRVSNRFSL